MKEKSVSVILAIFFGFWSWLYTYKVDATKFWIGLAVSMTLWWLFFIPNIIIYIWAVVDAASKDEKTLKEC